MSAPRFETGLSHLPLQVRPVTLKRAARSVKALAPTDRLDVKDKTKKAMKANRAADAIGDAMVKALTDMRPALATKYKLDEQLITLAIAQAAVDIAADAASQATGMVEVEQSELENRLHEVVFDAMNELLT